MNKVIRFKGSQNKVPLQPGNFYIDQNQKLIFIDQKKRKLSVDYSINQPSISSNSSSSSLDSISSNEQIQQKKNTIKVSLLSLKDQMNHQYGNAYPYHPYTTVSGCEDSNFPNRPIEDIVGLYVADNDYDENTQDYKNITWTCLETNIKISFVHSGGPSGNQCGNWSATDGWLFYYDSSPYQGYLYGMVHGGDFQNVLHYDWQGNEYYESQWMQPDVVPAPWNVTYEAFNGLIYYGGNFYIKIQHSF